MRTYSQGSRMINVNQVLKSVVGLAFVVVSASVCSAVERCPSSTERQWHDLSRVALVRGKYTTAETEAVQDLEYHLKLVAGTRVDYPLVQSDDNDYYLYHSFTGDALKAGAIFVDFRNSRTLLYNRNTVIYGHNMESGAMFHSLINYKDESFFRSKQIVISTFDGIYTFEVFSFYETKADIDYFRTWFQNDDDFVNFCTEEEKNSMYHKDGITFDGNSVIITLSTCITGVTDGRYCLHAILVDIEK